MSAAEALNAPNENAVASPAFALVGLPVREGRLSLGHQREALGPGACDTVAVVAGFQTAAWVGRPEWSPPNLGRLRWHATSSLDNRGRVSLDRRARAYLAVPDPAAFDVVVLRSPGGGLLLVPTDGFEARLAAVAS